MARPRIRRLNRQARKQFGEQQAAPEKPAEQAAEKAAPAKKAAPKKKAASRDG